MITVEAIKTKAGAVVSALGDLSSLAIDKMEEVANLNMSSTSYYSAAGIKQMRAASSIRDIDSLRKFTADSISLSGETMKKVLDDGKTWMGVGGDLKDKVTDIFSSKAEAAAKKKAAKVAAA